jgi:hypothetical protein
MSRSAAPRCEPDLEQPAGADAGTGVTEARDRCSLEVVTGALSPRDRVVVADLVEA